MAKPQPKGGNPWNDFWNGAGKVYTDVNRAASRVLTPDFWKEAGQNYTKVNQAASKAVFDTSRTPQQQARQDQAMEDSRRQTIANGYQPLGVRVNVSGLVKKNFDEERAEHNGTAPNAIPQWGPAKTNADAFSQDEFNVLSPRQQAFAQAQTQLWNAVQEDKAGNTALTGDQRTIRLAGEGYNKSLDDLFTKEGGSKTYAPRTVAVLQRLGLGDSQGDLDNYLNGSAFLSKQEIQQLGDKVPSTATTGTKAAYREADAAQSSDFSDLLSRGQSILGSLQGNKQYDYVKDMLPQGPASPLDNLSIDQTTALQDLMTGMAQRDTPVDLGNVYDQYKSQYNITPQQLQTFLSQNVGDWETGKIQFNGEMSPAEFRQKWSVQ